MMKKIVSAFIATIFLVASGAALAWKPTKTITMIVPFPPGSGNDLIARSLIVKLSNSDGSIGWLDLQKGLRKIHESCVEQLSYP